MGATSSGEPFSFCRGFAGEFAELGDSALFAGAPDVDELDDSRYEPTAEPDTQQDDFPVTDMQQTRDDVNQKTRQED
jgi:hypothetical protein